MKTIEALKKVAEQEKVPILKADALLFIDQLIDQQQLHSLLEIGTAIGYSAIHLAINHPALQIETIERDPHWGQMAKDHIRMYHLEEQVKLHQADALLLNHQSLLLKPYDLIFIDAAKAQYQRFVEQYGYLLNENGYLIIDNLDFHGMTDAVEQIKNRNTRQLVKKLVRFKQWIMNHPDFEVTYHRVGDGLILARRVK